MHRRRFCNITVPREINDNTIVYYLITFLSSINLPNKNLPNTFLIMHFCSFHPLLLIFMTMHEQRSGKEIDRVHDDDNKRPCCSRNNMSGKTTSSWNSSSGTNECFPGLIKIRNDLFRCYGLSSRSSGTPTAFSDTGIPISIWGSDSDLDPRVATESITCSF